MSIIHSVSTLLWKPPRYNWNIAETNITEILLKVALNTTNQIKCNQILQIKGTTLFLFPVLPEHFVVFDRFSLQTVTVCVEVLV